MVVASRNNDQDSVESSMPSVAESSIAVREFQIPRPFDSSRRPYATEQLVALFMLDRALKSSGRLLTLLEINLLVYVAHGWILGVFDRPLIENKVDQVQAWAIGPVLINLIYLLRSFGDRPLNLYDYYALLVRQSQVSTEGLLPDRDHGRPPGLVYLENNHADVVRGLDWVYETYTRYSGGQLITLTTQVDSPWALKYRRRLSHLWNGGCNGVHIPDYAIRNHYRRRVEK